MNSSLYKELFPALVRQASKRSSGMAEDVVQTAMVSALEGGRSLETEEDFRREVDNAGRSVIRSEGRQRARDASFASGQPKFVESEDATTQTINELIGELAPDTQIMCRRTLEGATVMEVADELNLDATMVGVIVVEAWCLVHNELYGYDPRTGEPYADLEVENR